MNQQTNLHARLYKISEEEMVALFIEHYSTAEGKPAILPFLAKRFGASRVNFAKFGFGKLGEFTKRHEEKFAEYRKDLQQKCNVNKLVTDEEDLIAIIEEYGFDNALSKIRSIYGSGPFSQFGYGSYSAFLEKHFENSKTYRK